MKGGVLTIFLAVVITLTLPAAVLAAGTTTQKIQFNFNDGSYETADPVTKSFTYAPASAVLGGNIRDKDGRPYLSPQTGTITIDGKPHQIMAKQIKESEPVAYWVYEEGKSGSDYYSKYDYWYFFSEVNIEGSKFIGSLVWYKSHVEWYGETWDYSGSGFSFNGVADRKVVSCNLSGDFQIR